jgi:hypothetical protein
MGDWYACRRHSGTIVDQAYSRWCSSYGSIAAETHGRPAPPEVPTSSRKPVAVNLRHRLRRVFRWWIHRVAKAKPSALAIKPSRLTALLIARATLLFVHTNAPAGV